MAQSGYTPIQLYHSSSTGVEPTAGSLADGELAINTTDGKLFYKDGSTVKTIATTAGANGDVVGPASATASNLAAFDGTTGKLIKQANTVTVAQGGTGASTLTANNVLLGNGTSALQVVAPGTSGNVLTSNGTTWASTTPAAQAYPGAGIAVSTGSAWTTSKTSPTGDIIGTTDTQTMTNKTLTTATLGNGYTETVYALSGTALAATNGSIQTKTLSGSTTFTDSLSSGQSVVLMLAGGSTNTVTWPTMTWVTSVGNIAPTLTAADTIVFWKISTTLYGARVGSYA